MLPPQVETERLLLRPLMLDDAPSLATILSDPVAMRWYPNTLNEKEIRTWIERQLSRYERDGLGPYACVWRDTNEFAGQCGLSLQELDGGLVEEIGYLTVPAFWGRGVAAEAAAFWRDFGFGEIGLKTICSLINVHNTPSQRVAEKIGMARGREFMRADRPHYVYSVDAP